jgi:hypothetical protein
MIPCHINKILKRIQLFVIISNIWIIYDNKSRFISVTSADTTDTTIYINFAICAFCILCLVLVLESRQKLLRLKVFYSQKNL